jgi:diphthamide biosynthesis enzyme Dph1/Dph2-like protein
MDQLNLELELENLFLAIKTSKAKSVLIQLPDGLKPKAKTIQKAVLEKFPKMKLMFWAGSCYGACDVPNVNGKDFDLLVQFGHSEWK